MKLKSVKSVIKKIKECQKCKNNPSVYLKELPICKEHWEEFGWRITDEEVLCNE